MAKENTREQKLKYAFGAHPSVQELHVASDDSMFLNAGDAKNHASTLKDKTVEVEKRADYIESKVEPAAPNQLELEALRARHLELFKQNAAYNAGISTLKSKIEAEEARLAEVAAKDAEALALGAGADSVDKGSEESGAEGGAE